MSRHVIVAEASRGIRRAIARRLPRDDRRIHNLDLSPPPDDSIPGETWVEFDLADATAPQSRLERLVSDVPVLGLVNNAAIGRVALMECAVALPSLGEAADGLPGTRERGETGSWRISRA